MKKQKGSKKRSKNSRAEKLCIVLLCAPAIIHLLVFWLGVEVETFRLMFTDYNTGKFTLENFAWAFRELFAGASTSNIALSARNTFLHFIKGSIILPLGMFFSYLIFRKCFGATFSRLALYLPGAVSGIAMSLLYVKAMESTGPIMQVVQNITGIEEPIMIRAINGNFYVMLFDVLIGVGGNLIMWLGGMNRIPYDLIEYGKLEGIGPFREFTTVVLPLMWPTFVTMVTLHIMGIFGSDGAVLTLTNGEFGTSTLSFWMYSMVKDNIVGEYNHVAALGMIFTVLSIPIVVLGRMFMNRFGEEVEY